eukprot:363842-Chlamydomonas_euryale.AAC.1
MCTRHALERELLNVLLAGSQLANPNPAIPNPNPAIQGGQTHSVRTRNVCGCGCGVRVAHMVGH